ncbi:Helicase, C-terminal [Dillenia turbinata]|uniref:RNA helicase n=1 Tax=Dillenia turbinata TaxID=194707 RepID=A0AAN8Z3E8_9MAGN
MAETEGKPAKKIKHEDKEEEEEIQTFEELGLDARSVRALLKKGITKPTLIQQVAIPLILEGKDVVARAKTGSGKTFAYLLPLLQKLFATDSGSKSKLAPSAFILVPSRELCQQVYSEVLSLIELCRVQLKKTALSGPPDVLVSTPACIQSCLSGGLIQTKSISDSLDILVLDEADLLLSYGYEDDLKALTRYVPRRCQCLLISDVDKLKKLILHNPVILTLPEVGDVKDEVIPKNVQQFWVSCSAHDKLLHILALLKLELVQKKVLIFTNTIDMGFRLRLFLEQFGIKSAVLNAELPQNSRLHILEEFNAGLFDYLIATDDSETREMETHETESKVKSKKSRKQVKPKLDSEFGVVRGIDFKNVYTVINFDMPKSAAGYVHRIGRTGRAHNTGTSVGEVEMEFLEKIKSILGDSENEDSNSIAPFPLLTKSAVESLRYRAEDVARSVTKVAVRESRAQDLRNEILNSEKLKAHFENNPRDLDLLKHDKILSKKPLPAHLQEVPEYLLDSTTEEARKAVKLARAAMGIKPNRHHGSKRKFRRSKDPLRALSAEGPKRKGKARNDSGKHKKRKSVNDTLEEELENQSKEMSASGDEAVKSRGKHSERTRNLSKRDESRNQKAPMREEAWSAERHEEREMEGEGL